MSLFLKNNNKSKNDILTLSFLRELEEKKKDSSEKVIKFDTESNVIAEIISEKLLEKIQKEIV
ncbi:MAG: hypothetical protein L3J25_04475 [Flavobacteriaceae bacterium]|nr:hypothetical protein [Flavobacteriaceae bacterium]